MTKKDAAMNAGKGAAKVGYGLARGAMAVATVTGHGLLGGVVKRFGGHTILGPVTKRAVAPIVQKGFKDAGNAIEDGVREIGKAVDDWKRA